MTTQNEPPVPRIVVYYKRRGYHVHCRVFCNGKCGDLVFRFTEWPVIQERLQKSADVRPDGFTMSDQVEPYGNESDV